MGSPVWAFSITPAVRQYLAQNNLDGKKIAVFATMGGGGAKRAFEAVRKMTPNSEVVGALAVAEEELESGEEFKIKIGEWIQTLQGGEAFFRG
ncbi:MAG: hypothetical protein GF334_03205 [Candidatus Altiarchaeales archaeon]|nr:hypothetical protein [Candidatus Altiarchaeales archaeon]